MHNITLVKAGLQKGITIVLRLARIVIPTIIFVAFLQTTTLLNSIGQFFAPLMQIVGLPGEAAVPFVVGIFTSIYGGIGAMLAIPLTPGELTILSIMISICHSAFIESPVVTEGGASASLVFGLRFISAFFAAWLTHAVGIG